MAVLCTGALLAMPLLLLKSGSASASHAVTAASVPARAGARSSSRPATRTAMPEWQLLRYRGGLPDEGTPETAAALPSATTTTVALPSTTVAPTTSTTPPPPTTLPPSTTTTTEAPPPTTMPPTVAVAADSAVGGATWYPEAAAGTCASPWLPFGTELHVVNVVTGASTNCVVDDREAHNTGRVVDLSVGGFSGIADLSSGLARVTISW